MYFFKLKSILLYFKIGL